jgi:hypothetical protein
MSFDKETGAKSLKKALDQTSRLKDPSVMTSGSKGLSYTYEHACM